MLSSSRGVDTTHTLADLFTVAVSRVLSLAKVHVLYGSEEHTQVVHRLDQFAYHSDGPLTRVEADVVFTYPTLTPFNECVPCWNGVLVAR